MAMLSTGCRAASCASAETRRLHWNGNLRGRMDPREDRSLETQRNANRRANVVGRAGRRIINGPARPHVEDELSFLVSAGNSGKFPQDAKQFEELLLLFLRKPRQAG